MHVEALESERDGLKLQNQELQQVIGFKIVDLQDREKTIYAYQDKYHALENKYK